jgi:hypothetical protein
VRAPLLLVLTLLCACGASAENETAPAGSAAEVAADPLADSGAVQPTAAEEEEEAVLRAQDAEEFRKREASMEDRQSCLAKAAQLPEAQRAVVEESCRRRP